MPSEQVRWEAEVAAGIVDMAEAAGTVERAVAVVAVGDVVGHS